MYTVSKAIVVALAVAAGTMALSASASPNLTTSEATVASVAAQAPIAGGDFVKKKKRIRGAWQIEARADGNFIVFNDEFRTSNGPDLKVFLSPTSISDVTGKTAVNGSVLVGVLKSNKGGQEYRIPAGVNLDDFESVLIHCEEFAVLWGGADL
ncbi:MAG: DM13 domain-containing protein [Pseudomonadota bacterium]